MKIRNKLEKFKCNLENLDQEKSATAGKVWNGIYLMVHWFALDMLGQSKLCEVLRHMLTSILHNCEENGNQKKNNLNQEKPIDALVCP